MLKQSLVVVGLMVSLSAHSATYQFNIAADGFAGTYVVDTTAVTCVSGADCGLPNTYALYGGGTVTSMNYQGNMIDLETPYVVWADPNNPQWTTYGDRREGHTLYVGDDANYSDPGPSGYSSANDFLILNFRNIQDFYGNSELPGINRIQARINFHSYCGPWYTECDGSISSDTGPFANNNAAAALDTIWDSNMIDLYGAGVNGIVSPFDANTLLTYSLTVSVVMDDYSTVELSNASITMSNNISAVPVPAAAWLFGSGLIGLVGMARRKKA